MSEIKITVLVENTVYAAKLGAEHGLAMWVEYGDKNILFDTGQSDMILHNARCLHVGLSKTDAIVLSHSHYDHTGGLSAVQNVNSRVKVIEPKDFNSPTEISSGVFTTGALGMLPKEQALVVKSQKGNIVITGCAHPGLGKILKTAGTLGDIYAVLGGFHGFSDFGKLEGIELIAPCHCTRHLKKIHRKYLDNFKQIYTGSVIEI